jgi:NADH:ubiquinone oxidoreductase subunit 4 (subunit M)
MTISFISIIFISIIILQQIDLKKIIAYSSIAHMNFAILGLFSNNIYGIEGSIYTMLSHGLISSMLFFCIGVLYDRYGERNILYYSNITQVMPMFSFFFFFAIVANMGVPGMSSFVGEFLLLLSLSYKSIILLFIISLSLFLTTIYCI